jgi:RNA polymerase subunit RPABC4/transcription elongation factor Spt4
MGVLVPKFPPKMIKATYCEDCGLSIRDGIATCQNCGSRDFETHNYILASLVQNQLENSELSIA